MSTNRNNPDTIGPIISNNQTANISLQRFHPLLATLEEVEVALKPGRDQDALDLKVKVKETYINEHQRLVDDGNRIILEKNLKEGTPERIQMDQSIRESTENLARAKPELVELKTQQKALQESRKDWNPDIFSDHLPIKTQINNTTAFSWNVMGTDSASGLFQKKSETLNKEKRYPAIKAFLNQYLNSADSPGVILLQESSALQFKDTEFPPGWKLLEDDNNKTCILYDTTRYDEMTQKKISEKEEIREDYIPPEGGVKQYEEKEHVQKLVLKDKNTNATMVVNNIYMPHCDNPKAASKFIERILKRDQEMYKGTVLMGGDFNNRVVSSSKSYLVNSVSPPYFNQGKQGVDWTDGFFHLDEHGEISQLKADTIDPQTGQIYNVDADKMKHLADHEELNKYKPFIAITKEYSLEKEFPNGLAQKIETDIHIQQRCANAFNHQKLMCTLKKENGLTNMLHTQYGAGKQFGEPIGIPVNEMKLLSQIYFSLEKKDQEKFSSYYKEHVEPIIGVYNTARREVPINEFKMLMQIYDSLGKDDKKNFANYHEEKLKVTCARLSSYQKSLEQLPPNSLDSKAKEELLKSAYEEATSLLTSRSFKGSFKREASQKIDAFNASVRDRIDICSGLCALDDAVNRVKKELDEATKEISIGSKSSSKEEVKSAMDKVNPLREKHQLAHKAASLAGEAAMTMLAQPKANGEERHKLGATIAGMAQAINKKEDYKEYAVQAYVSTLSTSKPAESKPQVDLPRSRRHS